MLPRHMSWHFLNEQVEPPNFRLGPLKFMALVYSAVHTAQCTVCSVQCTVYSVQSTIYIEQSLNTVDCRA